MLPALKSNAAVGYKCPEKIEFLKGVGLLKGSWCDSVVGI